MAASSISKATRWPPLAPTSSIAVGAFQKRLLHEGPDMVELLERHLVKEDKKVGSEEDEIVARRRLTSTKREVLLLDRDILCATHFFPWSDARGVPWRDVLWENARREFEEARYECDSEVITRLLIGGRDAVQVALDKLFEKHQKMTDEARVGEVLNGDRSKG